MKLMPTLLWVMGCAGQDEEAAPRFRPLPPLTSPHIDELAAAVYVPDGPGQYTGERLVLHGSHVATLGRSGTRAPEVAWLSLPDLAVDGTLLLQSMRYGYRDLAVHDFGDGQEHLVVGCRGCRTPEQTTAAGEVRALRLPLDGVVDLQTDATWWARGEDGVTLGERVLSGPFLHPDRRTLLVADYGQAGDVLTAYLFEDVPSAVIDEATAVRVELHGSSEVVGQADLDGDGVYEILGATPADLSVYEAATGVRLGSFAVSESVPAAMAVHDLTGDGRPDLVFAEPSRGSNTPPLGRVTIVSAYPTADRERPRDAVTVTGDDLGLGGMVATGDLDGDGQADLVVSADGDPKRGLPSLLAFLGPLRADTSTANADLVMYPSHDSLGLGTQLTLGDVDGDGRDDVVISAIYANERRGAVYLILATDWLATAEGP